MIINLYKKRGETPLQTIERFKKLNRDFKDQKMTYLGRLDPMAEGVLLIGTGEDTKEENRQKYFGLDKEYFFEVLFGFATDTYDVLGKITHPSAPFLTTREGELKNIEISEMDLIRLAKIYEGKREQKYPKYSSKIIYKSQKKKHSLEEFSSSDLIQPKSVTIYKMHFEGLKELSGKELFSKLLFDISKVQGDFRQAEILEMWNKFLNPNFKNKENEKKYFIAQFFASVSSGTYIRSIANDMGETLGIPTCIYSIKRTKLGDFKIEDSIKF